MSETAEAFASRVSAVMRTRDREGYKALFDLPCMVWGDAGPDLRADDARLDEAFDAIETICGRLGMVDHAAKIENVIAMGDTLSAMRVLTSLTLRDGSITDPTRELWILRETGGTLRIQALVNTMTAELLRPEEQPTIGFDAPPDGDWPVSGAAFVERMNRAYAERDVEANAAMLTLPYFRIGDDSTGLILTPTARARAIDAYHAALDRRGGGRERIELLAERPMGASYLILRVRSHGVTEEDGPYDSAQELWILHEQNGALRLTGVVNPASASFVSTTDFVDAGATQ